MVKVSALTTWIAFSCYAAICFATSDLLIGELAVLGPRSIFYYNLGGLVTAFFYFVRRYWMIKKGLQQAYIQQYIYKEDGTINTPNIVCFVGGTVIELFKIFVLTYNFYLAVRANLNIGIIACIWSMSPFVTAFFDYLFNN